MLVYGPVLWLAKTALLLQLMRIFTPSKSGPVYWIIHGLIWTNLAFYSSVEFAVIFECTPISKAWNPLYEGGHCIDVTVLIIAESCINVISGLLILLLPLWAIWHLRMATKRKAGIIAVFTTGARYNIPSFRRVHLLRHYW